MSFIVTVHGIAGSMAEAIEPAAIFQLSTIDEAKALKKTVEIHPDYDESLTFVTITKLPLLTTVTTAASRVDDYYEEIGS